MRKDKTDSSVRKTIARASVLVLGLGLGLSLLISGGTFAKWTSAISQMTGANIQIGDWVAEEPPVISTEAKLPDGNVGVEYRHQLEASNSDNATWSYTNLYGNLPSGLSLSKDGVLSGTPTNNDTYKFTITVKNSAGSDSRSFNIKIIPIAPVFAESQILPDAFDGKVYPSTILSAVGLNRKYELISGSLPEGLTLSSYGSINGTPVGYGVFTFTVKVSNDGGSDSKEFSINLNSDFPYITTTSLPDAVKDIMYTQYIAGSGPSPTYSVISGELPTGMSLNANTGMIQGYARGHGLSNFTISKTNSMGTATKELNIYVRYAAPTITTNSLPVIRKNVAYSVTLLGSGDESTFAISEGNLPDGLTLDAVTGVISGVTAELGEFNVTITKTNESGVATKSFLLESMLSVPVITTGSSIPEAFIGEHYEMKNTGIGEEIIWGANGLIDGLSIDPATGVISGTPTSTTTGSFAVTITATNSAGSDSQRVTLYVRNSSPIINTSALPNGEIGKPYSEEIKYTGVGSILRMSGSLPSGLNFNTTTGVISGTPIKSGAFNLTFSVTNNGGTATQPITLVIDRDAATITTTSLDSGMQGIAYSAYITGAGEASTHVVSNGVLPPGLSLNTSTGRITGTPNTSAHGSYKFTITKSNTVATVSQEFTVNVVYQTPTLTGSSVLTRATYDRNYSGSLPGVGNGATHAIINGKLPEGLTINDTGLISGTPTVTGDFSFTVQKSNESGTVSKDYTLQIVHAAPSMKTRAFDPATIGVPYSMQIEATGLDIVYSISYGELPDGLKLDSKTGIISGTPTVATSRLVNIDATNSGGKAYINQLFYSNHVIPTMSITSLPQGMVGVPYSAQIEAVGEAITYTAANLPSGLTVNSNTGVISGTPRAESTGTVTLQARNTGGTVLQKIPLIVITQPPTITLESFPDGTVGKAYSQSLPGEGSSNTVAITSGQLPPGISVYAANGSLTGTPTTRGTYTFTMTKTNISGSVSKEFTIKISYVIPTFTTAAGKLKDATIGQSYSVLLNGAGDAATYSISAGSLPPGLIVSDNVNGTGGLISGAPTASGNYTFIVLKSNLDGEVSREFSINVPTVTPASLSDIPSRGLLLLRSNLE